jgi:hypothetical protein
MNSAYRASGIAALIVLVGLAGPALAKEKKKSKPPKSDDACASGFVWSWPEQKRAFLGVRLLKLTGELRSHFGAPADAGVLIGQVEAGGPAQRAGVKVGDVLVAVDGEKVASSWAVLRRLRDRKKGDRVVLRVIRDRKPRELRATLDARARPEIEVGRFLDLEGFKDLKDGKFQFKFNSRCFDRAMRRMQRELGRHRHLFKNLQREEDLEQRLKQMEQKLRRLEKRLQGRQQARGRPTAA